MKMKTYFLLGQRSYQEQCSFRSPKQVRPGVGYVKHKFNTRTFYQTVFLRPPWAPNWPTHRPPGSKRLFTRAYEAREYREAVNQRYSTLALWYWKDYFGGIRGWFRKLRVQIRSKFNGRQ